MRSNIKDTRSIIKNYISLKIKESVKDINDSIDSLDNHNKSRYDELTKLIKELNDKITECIEQMPEKVGMEVGNHIVGESYIRWDLVTTYFPTLVFKFKESTNNPPSRTSQVKVRLKKKKRRANQSKYNGII